MTEPKEKQVPPTTEEEEDFACPYCGENDAMSFIWDHIGKKVKCLGCYRFFPLP
jgi:hypothetical protein